MGRSRFYAGRDEIKRERTEIYSAELVMRRSGEEVLRSCCIEFAIAATLLCLLSPALLPIPPSRPESILNHGHKPE